MSNENNNGFIDQLGRGLSGLFKFLVRLTFVLVLAVAIGAGLYYAIAYGIPALDRAYLQPVRDNTAAITELQSQADQNATRSADQITALQDRITALEVQNDTNLNTIDALQTQLDAMSTLADEQAALLTQVGEIEDDLAALDTAFQSAETERGTAMTDLQELAAGNRDSIDDILSAMAADDFPMDQAYADLQLVKAMALLTRAQVFIFQDNFGLANTDIENARTLLIAVGSDPALEGLELEPVLNRLSLAMAGLPQTPDQASADLAAAWDLLVDGISVDSVDPAETSEPVEVEDTESEPSPL